MKPFTNPLPKPPPSARPRAFDPWNSSSTGHQRREAPRHETDGVTETGWRTSRTLKINSQFKTQSHGAPPSAQNAEDAPSPSKKSIMDMLVRPGSMRESKPGSSAAPSCDVAAGGSKDAAAGSSRMFDGLVVYVNGSTFPLVSDHKLKTLLAENGARISLHLARRQVTHVILGRPAGASGSTSSGARAGCGGGLAGTKMDKEIRRIGGNGIKYVGVEWILESLKAGKRLPETRFSNLKIAAQGQPSVYSLSKKPA